jgi:bacteriorhodopsin
MFIWLAGIFRDSIPHLLASAVAIPSIVMAVLLLSWTFRRAPRWQTIYLVALLIAIAMLALFFSMVADVGMPGLQQRVFIFLFLLWLSIVVHKSVRLTA